MTARPGFGHPAARLTLLCCLIIALLCIFALASLGYGSVLAAHGIASGDPTYMAAGLATALPSGGVVALLRRTSRARGTAKVRRRAQRTTYERPRRLAA